MPIDNHQYTMMMCAFFLIDNARTFNGIIRVYCVEISTNLSTKIYFIGSELRTTARHVVKMSRDSV